MQNYKEESYSCGKCSYTTTRKDNLDRHMKFYCGKYTCDSCKLCFLNKKELKAHEKAEKNMEKNNKIMEFIGNRDNSNIENLIEKLCIDEDLKKMKQISQNKANLMKNTEKTKPWK